MTVTELLRLYDEAERKDTSLQVKFGNQKYVVEVSDDGPTDKLIGLSLVLEATKVDGEWVWEYYSKAPGNRIRDPEIVDK